MVTNTGNVPLTGITVVDDVLGPIDCPSDTLAPGEDMECTFTHTTTQADVDRGRIVNVAVVTGTGPGGEEVTADDDATVELTRVPPTTTQPGPPAPPAPPAPSGGADVGFLPRTGAEIGGFLFLAAILIGAGRLLVGHARRRPTQRGSLR